MKHTHRAIKPDASRVLAEVSRCLGETGIPAYLVGGFVRDVLLRRPTADIDIAIEADAVTVAPLVARALGGKAFPLDEVNRISRIVLPEHEWEIDLTSFSGSIEEDLARRDFTINAIAAPLDADTAAGLDPERLIDPFYGRDDIRRGMVRAVGDTVFRDDPVRLLRAARIAAELGFSIESGTEECIRRDGQLIASVAGERVREELLRLLALPGAGERLLYLDALGLLTAVIPELAPARGVDQPVLHVWDVLEHSIRTVAALEFVLRESSWEFAGDEILDGVPWSDELEEHFSQEVSHGSTRSVLLKLAALLHDIAKPQTKTVEENGRARFTGHPVEGAETAAAILERLRFSRREVQYVRQCVKYHMRPTQMSNEGLPTGRAIYRFFRDTGITGIDILFLCMADHLATRGETLDKQQWEGHAMLTAYVLSGREDPAGTGTPARILDGHDVTRLTGLPPGPEIGRLLESLQEARAAGEINDRQEAVAYLEQLLHGTSRDDRDEPSQGAL